MGASWCGFGALAGACWLGVLVWELFGPAVGVSGWELWFGNLLVWFWELLVGSFRLQAFGRFLGGFGWELPFVSCWFVV